MEAMGGDDLPPDLAAPSVVHKVKARYGYSEVHVPAPGFADQVRPLEFTNLISYLFYHS